MVNENDIGAELQLYLLETTNIIPEYPYKLTQRIGIYIRSIYKSKKNRKGILILNDQFFTIRNYAERIGSQLV